MPGPRITALRVLADLLSISAAFLIAFHVYERILAAGWIPRETPEAAPYIAITIVFAAVAVLVFWQQGLYEARATLLNLWELETAIHSVVLAAALLFAMLFFLDIESYSRFVVVGAIAVASVLVVLERRAMAALIGALRRRDGAGRRTLIYGCEKTGQLLMKKIVQSPHLGRVVVGFLDDHVTVGTRVCCRIAQTRPTLFAAPVLGRLDSLAGLATEHEAEELLVVGAAVGPERLQEILEAARGTALQVGVVPSLGDLRSDQLVVEDLSATPVLRPRMQAARPLGGAAKRGFDIVAAALLMAVTSPLWALAAAGIRFERLGSVFFSQQRVGRGGRPFKILKFRTMGGDAPPYMSSPPGDRDPRVGRIGHVLRRTGIDELPQLVNVLRGEMSLVGPRPEMPHLVQRYTAVERQRLAVRPGITGLWQLSADRHAEIHENIEYDLYYVNHQSILLDLMILFETLFLTLGLLLKGFDRPAAAIPDVPGAALAPPAEEPYLLVALDQRGSGALSASWHVCVPAAYAVSRSWPARIVVSEGNTAAVDAILAEVVSRSGAHGQRTTYAPYRSRMELRRLVSGARLVITDLAHVSQWAAEEGIDELTVENGGVRWRPRTRVPDPLVTELSQFLTIYAGEPEAAAVS